MPKSPKSTPPRKQPRYTVAQVVAAIRDQHGILSLAAKRLQCDRTTLYNYATKHPAVQAAMHEARESILDLGEARLFQQVDKGDLGAIKYLLSTQGKGRGYVERQEQTGKDGGPIAHTVTVTPAQVRAARMETEAWERERFGDPAPNP